MKTTTNSFARGLRVLRALKGHSLNGIRNADLAVLTGESPAFITRAMDTLIAEGFAARVHEGRFALSISMLQIAQGHATEMAAAADRIQEVSARINAGAR